MPYYNALVLSHRIFRDAERNMYFYFIFLLFMNMKSSGVWLRPLIGRGFKPWRGLIQGVQTIVLTLVDLTPMWLSSSDTRGLNLQQEPSLETMVYKKWPEPVLPGE